VTLRAAHYLNQFFAGVGGEESAALSPVRREGPVGPGRRLQALLGDAATIVTTVFCGDDRAASSAGTAAEVLALAGDVDLVIAGPAFTRVPQLASARQPETAGSTREIAE
jgi:betaine reductase